MDDNLCGSCLHNKLGHTECLTCNSGSEYQPRRYCRDCKHNAVKSSQPPCFECLHSDADCVTRPNWEPKDPEQETLAPARFTTAPNTGQARREPLSRDSPSLQTQVWNRKTPRQRAAREKDVFSAATLKPTRRRSRKQQAKESRHSRLSSASLEDGFLEAIYVVEHSTPGREGTTLTADVTVRVYGDRVYGTIDFGEVTEGSVHEVFSKLGEWCERMSKALRNRPISTQNLPLFPKR